MTALPSPEPTPVEEVTTFADRCGPKATNAALNKAIAKESVWLRKGAAGGAGLRSEDFLRYIVGVDRADNNDGTLTWHTKSINTRCGITTEKSKPVTHLLAQFTAAGLLDEDALTSRPGQAIEVTIERTTANDSLRIPLGIGWKHRWSKDVPTGPRYGKDTRYVMVFLTAWLLTADYTVQGVIYKSRTNHLGLPDPAKVIADNANISLATYRRAWDTVRRVCADEPWITWERVTRSDDGQDSYFITVDWSKAPVLLDASVGQTPPTFEQGTPFTSAQGDPLEVSTLSYTSASESVLPPPSAHVTTTADSRRSAKDRRRKESKVIPLQPKTSDDMLVAVTGTRPTTAANDKATHQTAPFDAWLLAVVAAITTHSNPRRLPLTAYDAQRLHTALSGPYNAGWAPAALAAVLTADSPNVDNAGAALGWRIDHRLGAVNEVPEMPKVRQTAAERRAAEEHAAFMEDQSCRDASKYTQRTM